MINQLTDTQLKATTGGALPPTEFQFEAMHAAREMGGFATNQERLAWINNYIQENGTPEQHAEIEQRDARNVEIGRNMNRGPFPFGGFQRR